MKLPRLPLGLAEATEAESIYQRDLNRYLADRERAAWVNAAGMWTPTLVSGDGTSPTVTYGSNNRARWVRVGPMVFVTGRLSVSSVSGGSGHAAIGGLPFTVTNDAGAKGVLTFGNVSGFSSTTTPRAAVPIVQNAYAYLWRADSADARDALNTQVAISECVAPLIFFSGQYLT